MKQGFTKKNSKHKVIRYIFFQPDCDNFSIAPIAFVIWFQAFTC